MAWDSRSSLLVAIGVGIGAYSDGLDVSFLAVFALVRDAFWRGGWSHVDHHCCKIAVTSPQGKGTTCVSLPGIGAGDGNRTRLPLPPPPPA